MTQMYDDGEVTQSGGGNLNGAFNEKHGRSLASFRLASYSRN